MKYCPIPQACNTLKGEMFSDSVYCSINSEINFSSVDIHLKPTNNRRQHIHKHVLKRSLLLEWNPHFCFMLITLRRGPRLRSQYEFLKIGLDSSLTQPCWLTFNVPYSHRTCTNSAFSYQTNKEFVRQSKFLQDFCDFPKAL